MYDASRDQMILVGGLDSTGDRRDAWTLSFTANEWTKISPERGELPFAAASAVFDSVRDRLIVVGGRGDAYSPLPTEAWELGLSRASEWKRLETANEGPRQRVGHSSVFDALNDRLIMFGGYVGGNNLDETWFLKFDATTSVSVALVDLEVSVERVRLHWRLATQSGERVEVERGSTSGGWEARASLFPDGTGNVSYEDRDLVPGERLGYRLVLPSGFTSDVTWVDVPGRPLHPSIWQEPNPSGSAVSVAFVLTEASHFTRIELLDLAGRRIAMRSMGDLGPGTHRMRLPELESIEAGLYLLRLTNGAGSAVAKIIRLP
jgi:hypothetical protein